MKNVTTPRTLADAEFRTGYAGAWDRIGRKSSFVERALSVVLATFIGIALAVVLVHWSAQ